MASEIENAATQGPSVLHAQPASDARQTPPPTCTICNASVAHSFTVHGYRLFECRICDFAFIDPATQSPFRSTDVFDDHYFHGGGAGYANYLDEAQLLRAHGNRYGTLLRSVGATRVLDVGAAAGFILAGMQDSGCTGIGIEPNASMAAFAVREFGLDVRATTLEGFDTAERFDAVALLQVVDHLENVRLSFERVGALTAPGGWCLIEFGNRASITARILRTAWHEYAPPSVQRVFSLRALQRLLSDYGFVLYSSGHPKKYLRADHAVSLLRYKAAPWLGEKLFATLAGVIPADAKLRYVGDDISWALFRRR